MKIIFVCSGNTCRSPMAEGIMNKKLQDMNITDISVSSAGIGAIENLPASDEAVSVMRDYGIDISNHLSHAITYDDIDNANLILTMTKSHKELLCVVCPENKDKIFTIMEYGYKSEKSISDPYGMGKEAYRECASEIDDVMDKVIKRIRGVIGDENL